jgi:hypothetical protein
MPSDYVRALNRQTDAISAGLHAQATAISSGMQAQAQARLAQTQAEMLIGFAQIRSEEFQQAQQLAHQRDMVADQRRYEKAERERTENERYRRLAFRQAVLAANPGQPVDEMTVEFLWREFEAKQRADGEARFSALVRDLQGQLQAAWAQIGPEVERLKAVRPLTTSRRFVPVAVILGIATCLMAVKGVLAFLCAAGLLGGLGYTAIKRYRAALPSAPSGKGDLVLVAAGRALPIAAIPTALFGAVATMSGFQGDDGSLLLWFGTTVLAVWALVKRKKFYGLEAEQADLDARVAAYRADAAWVNSLSFEAWYASVLRQPLSLPGAARG